MNDAAIHIDNVSKYFRLYGSPKHRLLEVLNPSNKQYHKKHWALRDISLEVRKGEFLGILGRNGCGKSTLLKLIAGVLTPNGGSIAVNGQVSALLELGSGMNPEFTGTENIYFYGTVLGLTKKEIDEKLEEILAFADIGEYIDQPLKRYSSGMKARLAFSVSTSIVPDILIVDEVLSVGDIFFRQKCHQRIEQLVSNDTTVLLVSHNLSDVARYCSRAVFLHDGNILFDGDAREATTYYQKYFRPKPSNDECEVARKTLTTSSASQNQNKKQHALSYLPGWELRFWPTQKSFLDLSGTVAIGLSWVNCNGIAVCDAAGTPTSTFPQGTWAHFFYEFELIKDVEIPFGVVRLTTGDNIVIHGKWTLPYLPTDITALPSGTTLRFAQRIQLNILPGQYTVDVGINMISCCDFQRLDTMSRTEIVASIRPLDHVDKVAMLTIIDPEEDLLSVHHLGRCDLPGDSQMGILT